LRGVAGRVAGRVPGYAYSRALKSANLKLDRAGLDSFLTAPVKQVPGTKMPIGVPSADDRAAIIRHLETLK
jgi:cytochrome c2